MNKTNKIDIVINSFILYGLYGLYCLDVERLCLLIENVLLKI